MQTQFSDGGGLLIAFMFYSNSLTKNTQPQNNSLECWYSTLKGNRGHNNIGSGTEVFAICQSSLSTMLFSNCDWIENESAMAAAVFITPATGTIPKKVT
jgi:hypothetical protein